MRDLQILRANFANSGQILRIISTRFSMVQLSVTPVYYREYYGLLVDLN